MIAAVSDVFQGASWAAMYTNVFLWSLESLEYSRSPVGRILYLSYNKVICQVLSSDSRATNESRSYFDMNFNNRT